MPKKSGRGKKMGQQVTCRVSEELYGRIEATANALGLLPSNLLRMILMEKLPEYEDRGNAARPQKRAE